MSSSWPTAEKEVWHFLPWWLAVLRNESCPPWMDNKSRGPIACADLTLCGRKCGCHSRGGSAPPESPDLRFCCLWICTFRCTQNSSQCWTPAVSGPPCCGTCSEVLVPGDPQSKHGPTLPCLIRRCSPNVLLRFLNHFPWNGPSICQEGILRTSLVPASPTQMDKPCPIQDLDFFKGCHT